MNDEVRQLYRESFVKIILGIVAVSLVACIVVAIFAGMSSPWFIRAVALLLLAIISYIIYLVGRLVVGAYLLIAGLSSLLILAFLQPVPPENLTPFFTIPIVAIASILMSPTVTMLIAALLIIASLGIVIFSGQLTLYNLIFLLPAFALTLVVALLSAENKRNFSRISGRLVENRLLLRSRALELMQTLKRVEDLEQQGQKLKQQLKKVQQVEAELQSTVSGEHQDLQLLVQGTIRELNFAVDELDRAIENLGDISNLNGNAEILDRAWKKLHRLKTLVVNLEDMAQVEQNDFQLDLDEVDVGQLVAEVAGTAQGLARAKNLEVRHHMVEGLPPVQADAARLRQVLLQLVNNAIKFTDQGIIEIRAELDNQQLVIFVSDTGIGMSGEEAELIFEQFGRGNNSQALERQGTGLGLAISKRLIELHGGRMWVSSVADVGSTFYLSLPLDPVKRMVPPTPAEVSNKSTLRLDIVSPADAGETLVSPARLSLPDENGAPPAPAEPAQPALTADDDGATLMVRTQPRLHITGDGETLMLRRPDRANARNVTQPIHRYQPMYIKRFGFILLGLLAVVLLIAAVLAAFNQIGQSQQITATPVQVLLESKTPATGSAAVQPTATVASAPATPAPTVGFIAPKLTESAPTSAPAEATPLPADTATPLAVAVELPTIEPTRPRLEAITVTPSPTAVRITPRQTTTAGSAALNNPPAAGSDDFAPVPISVASGLPKFITTAQDSTPPDALFPHSRVSWFDDVRAVFAGEQAGNRDIFAVDAGGTVKNLTQSAGDDIQPDWSADGKRIVFSSGRTGNFNIFSMAADGSDLVQLTTSRGFDEWPVWSPDGRKIAFVSDRSGNVELYLMSATGHQIKRLTFDPADDWPVSWSPDGRWLVFSSNRDGNWNLYVVAASGSQPIQLTGDPADERDPIWSPDGRAIGFVHNGGGNFDVYTLPVPTGFISEVPSDQWTQVTRTPADERFPTWSGN